MLHFVAQADVVVVHVESPVRLGSTVNEHITLNKSLKRLWIDVALAQHLDTLGQRSL